MHMLATPPAPDLAQDALPDNVDAIVDAAAQFQSISLADLGQSALMDRLDSKFIVPVADIPALLSGCAGRYRVLEVNGRRLCGYATTYYDTADLAFYRAHQTGRLPRRKVRVRDYVDTGARFLEEKVKNNLGLQLAFEHECSAFPNVAIVEVKRAQRSRSAFLDDMRTRNLRASSFSKYCLGVSVLRGDALGHRAPSALRLLSNADARSAYAG